VGNVSNCLKKTLILQPERMIYELKKHKKVQI